MVKTIFTVKKIVGETTDFSVYFESYHEAFVFAKKEAIRINGLGGSAFKEREYIDGSFSLTWDLDNIQILMNDFAWVTDYCANGIKFYDESGLPFDFETMEDLRSWFALKRKLAEN